jgi:hypothetical protein
MNQDLLQAILAMDAYNRTGADDTPRNLVVDGTRIGNVNVLSGANGVSEDRSSGFFAQVYQDVFTQQKTISYRGTDFTPASELIKDGVNGWTVGAGIYTATQAQEAAQFFQRVVANGNPNQTLADLYNANVLLTGHSLGGGLAGFVASIYKSQSNTRIFDSMAFAAAAAGALAGAQPVMLYSPDGTPLGLGVDAAVQAVRDIFFEGEAPATIGSSTIGGYSVSGQIISPGPFPTGWAGAS